MKRSAPLKRSPFPRQRKESPRVEREPHPKAEIHESDVIYQTVNPAVSVKPLRVGTYGPATLTAEAKPHTYRDSVLLEMAQERRCLLLAVEHCRGLNGDTTVACHANEGKGMGIKASDAMSVWGCIACHSWLDQGKAPKAEKRRAFEAAHERQVRAWARIAADMREPDRFRRAAQRALDQLQGEEHGS